ncbi:MAG: carbohydrate porin [Candidatus Omnitrophota bacterium]
MPVSKVWGVVFAAGLLLAASCGCAQAANDLESRVAALEEKLEGSNLLDGLNLGVGATMVIQGTSNANGSGITANNIGYKGNETTDASYSADIELEKEFDNGAKAFLHLETGEGNGVTDDLELFSNVNQDANPAAGVMMVSELFWEQNFDDTAILTFGKIDSSSYIDANEYAGDECAQFLGSMFKRSPVIEFPDNTIGIRLGVLAADVVEIEAITADGDADFNQIADSLWWAVQANLKPELMGRAGNYRVYYWYNDAPHTKWNAAAKIKEEGSGFGVSFDQEITDDVGIFLRCGWQQDEAALDTTTFSLESSYSAGMQFNGTLWGRDEDVLGFAYGFIYPSDEYKKAGNLQAKTEGHAELYYNYRVNENLSVTPDIQMITNPYGKDAVNGTSTILVGGIRTQIDF